MTGIFFSLVLRTRTRERVARVSLRQYICMSFCRPWMVGSFLRHLTLDGKTVELEPEEVGVLTLFLCKQQIWRVG